MVITSVKSRFFIVFHIIFPYYGYSYKNNINLYIEKNYVVNIDNEATPSNERKLL